MDRLVNLLVTFFCVFIIIFPSAYILKQEQHDNFKENAATARGTVLAFQAGLLVVDFDTPIINPCGDTQIFVFLNDNNGLSLQLKPVFIPEAKAEDFIDAEGNVILFPVWDIMPLLQAGEYSVEVFVNNTCGFVDSAMELKPFTLEIQHETTDPAVYTIPVKWLSES